MNLKNKKVLITGSSSGIGQVTAIEFAKKGAIVFINYRKKDDGAKKTLEEVNKYSKGEIFKADLEDYDKVKNMIDDIVEKYGNIDILINNVTDFALGNFDDFDIWENQFKNVVMTTVYTTAEFLASTSGPRKIINTSSAYGTLEKSSVVHPHYSAMKAAVSNITVTLAKQYDGESITVNAIAPGWTLTQNFEEVSEERKIKIAQRTAIKRFVTMEEIAHTFIYIAENDAINGQIIEVDGGLFTELV